MMKYILLIAFWLILYNAYFWLHEFAGHYLANLLSGISPNQMEILWAKFNNLNIRPVGVEVLEGGLPQITYFAGGFVAGLIFLSLSIPFLWKFYRKTKQGHFWVIFAISLGFSGVGFTEFVFEGFFLEHHGSTLEKTLFNFFGYIFPSLLSGWHYRNRILDWYKAI